MLKKNCFYVILYAFAASCCILPVQAAVDSSDQKAALKNLRNSAIPFIENKGQIKDPGILFYLNGKSGTVLYRDNAEIVYRARSQNGKTVFTEKFTGIFKPALKGGTRTDTNVSYFTGSNKAAWKTGLTTYRDISFQNLYRGISVQFIARGSSIEDVYSIDRPSDTSRIKVKVDGVDRISLDSEGNLVFETSAGRFLKTRPVAYQQIGAVTKKIDCRYVVANNTYSFHASGYANGYPLIIDPDLQWSTFVGGSGFDGANDIKIDSSGNVYVAGATGSNDFPGPTGFDDRAVDDGVLVFKLTTGGGSLAWASFFGGSTKGYTEFASALDVDGSGNVYVTGETNDTDFPTTSGTFSSVPLGSHDAFVCKISADGSSLLWSTYLGGTGWDSGLAIKVTSSGDVLVAGTADGPTAEQYFATPGAYDATANGDDDVFVAKLSGNGGTLRWATLIGGEQIDMPHGISQVSTGAIIVAGDTFSSDFPSTPGAYDTTHGGNYDGFVLKLSEDGSSLAWSTLLGGASSDSLLDMALDSSGNIYVTGNTRSTDFPVTTGAYQTALDSSYGDAFVTKLSPGGDSVIWSTFLGGTTGLEERCSIALDGSANVYVTGDTSADDFPTTDGAYDREYAEYYPDVFISKLSPDGSSLLYGTYVGGEFDDNPAGIAVDSSGDIYIAGNTGSEDFPTTASALSRTLGGSNDIFVLKLSPKGTGGGGDGSDGGKCPAESILGKNSPELAKLRAFRDNVLSKTPAGRALIALYYKNAPFINRIISNSSSPK